MGEPGTQVVGTEPQPPPGYHPLVHTRPLSPLVNGPPFHLATWVNRAYTAVHLCTPTHPGKSSNQPPTRLPDNPCPQSCLSSRLHVGGCPAHARTSQVLTPLSALVPMPGHLGPTPAFRRTPGHFPGLTPSLHTDPITALPCSG